MILSQLPFLFHSHLHPGYSMFDWTHYTQSAGDLTGVGGQLLRVSAEELAKHDTEEDAWTVVRGRYEGGRGREREGGRYKI